MSTKLELEEMKESARRRRERIIIVVTIFVVIGLTYLESRIVESGTRLPLSGEVLIFGLININLILIILLIFLIVRNVVKLVFERRRGVLGSRLRTKLVVAFVSLSLIPTAVLFLVSTQFLSYSVDNWFNVRLEEALESSLAIGQTFYDNQSTGVLEAAKQISRDITRDKLYERERSELLKNFLEDRLRSLNLESIEVILDNRDERIIIHDSSSPGIQRQRLTAQMRDEIYLGKEVMLAQPTLGGELVSGFAPLYINFELQEVIGITVASNFISGDLADKLSLISRTAEEYRQFNLLKNPIKSSFTITLFIVTLLIIFSATWFGLFLAKGITGPIQDLAEATDEISKGNLDYHIDVLADDEIGILVDSFNRMTEDLKKHSNALMEANIHLEERRHYMETVLRNVSAGVVSLDKEGIITTVNRAAETMLGIKTDKVLNRHFEEVLKTEHMGLVSEILKELREQDNDFLEKQAQLMLEDRVINILISTTVLRDERGNYMGMVVVFEDISQLQKAERMAAWREVARRIAHEIKNPLTPVKLSAERLQKKYGDRLEGQEKAIFRECTGTIVNQVNVLKNLVDEFSKFARLPLSNPVSVDLNDVLVEPVFLFKDAHKDIDIEFVRNPVLPLVMADAEQIRRVMVNLLDNAVAAIAQAGRNGEIKITMDLTGDGKKVRVEVADNGVGIEPRDRMKLFEPYFSTKKAGMGLGLTIVSSIMNDHGGIVGIRDNDSGGTVVYFEIPLAKEQGA